MTRPTIHRNAGPPPPRRSSGRKRLYRFDLMEVGDAIYIPLAGRKVGRIDAAHNSLRTAATQWVRRHCPTARFEVRVLEDEGQVGCWRMA